MGKKAKYYRRPDGLYETIRKIDGKRVPFRGRTCAEVDRKMLEYTQEREKGRYVPAIVSEWLRTKEEAVKAGDLAENSLKSYGLYAKRLSEAFKGVRASEVEPRDLKRYIRAMESEGYYGKTVGVNLSVIKQVFSHAVLMGDVAISPAVEIKKSRNLPAKERLPLTEAEERLVETYRGPDWMMGLILLYTGCRKGELLALEWQDIDRQNKVIHFTKKLDHQYCPPKVDHRLKNMQRRDAPLFDVLADVLPRNRLGPIFTNADGTHLTNGQYAKRWAAYRDAVGLGEHVTAHCFRHSYATICYEAGIDEKACAAFLGDTEEVTRGIYQKLRDRHHQISAEAVNLHLSKRAETLRMA